MDNTVKAPARIERPLRELMTEVNSYAKEHNCSLRLAFGEVTKATPELWSAYSSQLMAPSARKSEIELENEKIDRALAYAKEHKCCFSAALYEIEKAELFSTGVDQFKG
jgi:hypothetical protein